MATAAPDRGRRGSGLGAGCSERCGSVRRAAIRRAGLWSWPGVRWAGPRRRERGDIDARSTEDPRSWACGSRASEATKEQDAAADVLIVDKHDYHTFQPLLYQVATDLLEPPTVGHPLRDLFHDHPNVKVKQATVTGIDLDKRKVSFAEMKPVSYDYLVLGLGATVNFFGVAGAPKHAFPMYTLPDAVRLKDHVLERWDGGGPRPGPRSTTARSTSSSSAPARPGRERRRARRAVPAGPGEGLPRHPAGQGSDHRGRGRGRRPVDVQEGPADLREEGAREAHGRDHARRGWSRDIEPTRIAS